MKSIPFCLVLCVTLAPSTLVADQPAAAPTQVSKETIAPFFAKYCVNCHGPDEQEGQVRLDTVAWQITTNDTAQRWQDLLDILNSGDMPPEGETQPRPEELTPVLRTLTRSLIDARRRLTDQGGEIAMRRLNRREYAATIREIFGFDLPVALIPPDAETDSFDTVGADQYFTSSDFDEYFNLGEDIVTQAFAWAGKPREESRLRRNDPEKKITPRMQKELAEHREKLALIEQGKSWKEAGFKDEGDMKLFINRAKSKQNSERYLEYPRVDDGQYVAPPNNVKRASFPLRADPRAKYRLRIHGGVRAGQAPIRSFVQISHGNLVTVLKLHGTESNPQTTEWLTQKQFGPSGLLNPQITALQNQDKKIDPDGDWAAIWIDYLEYEGPIYPKDRSFFEQLTHPTEPARRKNTFGWNDKNADDLIRQFATKAFRGVPPTEPYVEQLVKLFRANRDNGQTYQAAMTEPLAIVLTSPHFLFIQEATDPGVGKHYLTDRELAIRLSYFLWSCPPDEELNKLAADRKLSDPAVLSAQVNRMLDDPKSMAFFEGFVGQWADLHRFDAITVDPKQFVGFNDGLRQSARREVIEFFKTLAQEDLPAGNLIDSDFVVVDPLLRVHYELDDGFAAIENRFDKVDLPTESPRGGLLGQMAFLTLGSNGERSSPVIRGAWVMEKLLHSPPPPPPPNVPELGAASKKPVTNRQMVLLHQQQTVCSSCHKRMDVIGFALENFDTIGRWRETELVNKKQVPIDPSGTLPSGVAFKDIHELKAILITQKHRLALELCEALTAYGIGRTIEFSDTNAIHAMLRKNHTQDYRVRSMITEIVTSPLFRTK